MIEQTNYPFASNDIIEASIETSDNNKGWFSLIIMLLLFCIGGFLYIVYQKKRLEKELENEGLKERIELEGNV